MKIGIIIHSQTGNTQSVAEKLQEKLLEAGHTVTIEKVRATNDNQLDIQKINLVKAPDISGYDVVIFGAPVRAFSLSPVFAAYLGHLGTLQRKTVVCFVTQFFPFAWMGGSRAIKQMKNFCELRGGRVISSGIVNWSRPDRATQVAKFVADQERLIPKQQP